MKLLFLIIFLFLVVVFSLDIITFLALMLTTKGENIKTSFIDDDGSCSFKYLVVDSVSNTSKRGIVSLNNELKFPKGVDYITDEPFIGVHILVSKFGFDEFVCSGTCFCANHQRRPEESKNTRRASSTILLASRRGLVYLVSAVTSIIAIQRAEEYYREECILGLENECEYDSIHSKVDHCKSINDVDESSTESPKSSIFDDEEEEEGDQEPDVTEFRCTGHCFVRSTFGKDKIMYDESQETLNEWIHKAAPDIFTRNLIMASFYTSFDTGMVNVGEYCQNLELTTIVSVERREGEEDIPFGIQEENAIDIFTTVHLHKFCKGNSLFSTKQYKDKFFLFEFDPENSKILWDEMFKARSKLETDTIVACKSGKRHNYAIGENMIFQTNNVVCLRKFSDEEWGKGIPYESENLRHWKEGYRIKPDKLTRDQMFEYLYVLIPRRFIVEGD